MAAIEDACQEQELEGIWMVSFLVWCTPLEVQPLSGYLSCILRVFKTCCNTLLSRDPRITDMHS